ncbi:hypothetical protein CDAR_467901 [Caerostris darwini]|uniref:DUF19 domain-containing protein n=1 Tax=Caerostris darwini TaxID=1538125 RepID=A0AAV4MMK4_9ARAC|nr:hypothetical protein CDAR_467901 [Caerostris darwini]
MMVGTKLVLCERKPLMPTQEFMKILNCAATSENKGEMCDKYLNCTRLMPQKYQAAYIECVPIYNPDGIGQCTKTEELYHSEDAREKIYSCIIKMVDTKKLTESELDQMTIFQDCLRNLKCSKKEL